MTKTEFDQFLLATVILCIVGAIVNLVQLKRRGANAKVMALAFLVLGGSVQAYRVSGPSPVFYIGVAAVLCLLFADFAMRQGGKVRIKR